MLKACDATDGVTDGVVDDPDRVQVRPRERDRVRQRRAGRRLPDARAARCDRAVYAPLVDDKGVVYEGQPVGAEAAAGAWQTWITGNERAFTATGQPALGWAFTTEFFKNFVFADPSWDYSRYDVAKSGAATSRLWTSLLNAENPDLTAFRARHGKLLLWHGWADPALNPLATIRYYKDVVGRDPRAADDVRLFLLPGVLHCAGGPGPSQFDPITPIVEWVERAPPHPADRQKAAAGTQPARSRPVCAYPAKAAYKGSGSTDDAANFVCK